MSIDKERKKTVKIINKKLTNSEKQLLTIYKGSLNNIRGQLLALNERSEWTLNELRKYDRLQKLQLEIYKEIKDVSLKTYNEIRRTNKDIFITDYDRSSYAITKEAGIFLDFSKLNAGKINAIVNMPYPNVPLKDFIKKIGSDTYEKLKVILGTNMATGASLQNASKQIKDLLGVSYRKALTISRTEGLRASSKAQLEVTEQAIDKGLDIQKRWMSTLDMKTRESHAHLDGQLADKDGYFHSGIFQAQAPRMFGVGHLDINCRCTYVEEIEGMSEPLEKRMDNTTKQLIDNMDYTTWYEKYGKGLKKETIIKDIARVKEEIIKTPTTKRTKELQKELEQIQKVKTFTKEQDIYDIVENGEYKKLNLTRPELTALKKYTSLTEMGGQYLKINKLAEKGIETATMINLESAISKMPKWKGKVYRTIGFDSEKQFVNLFNKWKDLKGKKVSFNRFTSTTTDKKITGGVKSASGFIELDIKSKNGRVISPWSEQPDEFEVLFKRNTSFKIKKIIQQMDYTSSGNIIWRFSRLKMILEEI